jgi:hypothetical protein
MHAVYSAAPVFGVEYVVEERAPVSSEPVVPRVQVRGQEACA